MSLLGASSQPETRYASVADQYVAYQVAGDGPVDLLVVYEWHSHQELRWEQPEMARFYRSFERFARVITFDKRGTGLSDPVGWQQPPSLELWCDDILAVMDAAGAHRPVVFATGVGGPLAMVFAATHPERVDRLILLNTAARIRRAPDYAPGIPDSIASTLLAAGPPLGGRSTGYGDALDRVMVGDRVGDPAFVDWLSRWRRQAGSPGTFQPTNRMLIETDVRSVLPSISAPTLVLHRQGDRWTRVDNGRYLASNIPGAAYKELPGDEHPPWLGDVDALAGEIEEFVTGERTPVPDDRILATVLFSDIVDSTATAAALGDRMWAQRIAEHDAVVRRQLSRHRGQEVATTGDGFLATFDGPARAIACAAAMRAAVRGLGLEIRVGLHTGECQFIGNDVRGLAVNIAARVAAEAGEGEILVSQTVKDLVAGSGITFSDRGRHILKGVPGEWSLFAVIG